MQQEYSSINYSEVAGELIRLGVNVLAQLVAVSAEDVKKFIESAKNRYAKDAARGDMAASDSEECKGRRMDSHRSEDNVSTITYLDLNCDAESDAYLTTPDTSSEAEKISVDSDGDGYIDSIYADTNRDGQVDISIYDTDADGQFDLIGHHLNGDFVPYRYETYPG